MVRDSVCVKGSMGRGEVSVCERERESVCL